MKASVVRIGNSRGIRLPKPVIEQCGFEDEVELEVHQNQVIIRPSGHPRKGWREAFRRMSGRRDDVLLDAGDATRTTWDQEEWAW